MDRGPVEDVEQELGLDRVKVYRLNANGNWDDRGTGFITVQHLEQSGARGLVVMDDAIQAKPLLIHRISPEEDHYQQQDGTIVTWNDAEAKADIALSFQEASGCQRIWEQIQVEQNIVRGRKQANGDWEGRRHLVDEMEASANPEDGKDVLASSPVDLPPPELRYLEQIAKIVIDLTGAQKEDVATKMLNNSYLRRLLDVFRSCEDLEDIDSLRMLFEIMKNTIMLGDTRVMNLLFREENVMDVIGALEYDPEILTQQRHRDFLRDVVIFKEVVPLRKPALKAKIHQTYRMGYVKDVILPRVLDDGTFNTLSSMMLFNNVDILEWLMEDADFLRDLFHRFKFAQPGSDAQVEIVEFLQELSNLSKCLQLAQKRILFQRLVQLGLFEGLHSVLCHCKPSAKLKAMDVMLACVQYNPQLLREHLLTEGAPPDILNGTGNHTSMFDILIGLLTRGASGGLQEHAVEVLRVLLDSESLTDTSEKSNFLERFYSSYMKRLCGILETAAAMAKSPREGPSPAAINLILEILCFCTHHHGVRIKYFILQNEMIEKVLRLLHRPERWLVVAAIRFVRACLTAKDEFYNRHIISHNLLEPIITVFVANGERYNLLNSVVLEMFDFIRRENIKSLTAYFMDKLYSHVEDVDYDATFLKLKDKYEQSQDYVSTQSAAASSQLQASRIRRDERALDRDEDRYFEEDDDDEEQPPGPFPEHEPNGAMSFIPRLVDYDDEDEGEDLIRGGQLKYGPSKPVGPIDKRARIMTATNQRSPLSSPPLKNGGNLNWSWDEPTRL